MCRFIFTHKHNEFSMHLDAIMHIFAYFKFYNAYLDN